MTTTEGIRARLLFIVFWLQLLEPRVRLKFDISTLEVEAMTSSRPGQGEGVLASKYQKGCIHEGFQKWGDPKIDGL